MQLDTCRHGYMSRPSLCLTLVCLVLQPAEAGTGERGGEVDSMIEELGVVHSAAVSAVATAVASAAGAAGGVREPGHQWQNSMDGA